MHLPRLVLACALVLATSPALAQSAGTWTVGVGVHNVAPKSNNGTLVGTPLGDLKMDIANNARPTITGEYFVKDNLGVEVLASLPFLHDINVVGVGKVGSTKHLPPTVSLQYHFDAGKVRPFIGAGVNDTRFFSTHASGPIAGNRLSLSDSWGLAAHLGVDFPLSEKGALRIDYRYLDIDTKVKLNGANLGNPNRVHIDPSVYGVAYVYTF
jgi:outer membrane protein